MLILVYRIRSFLVIVRDRTPILWLFTKDIDVCQLIVTKGNSQLWCTILQVHIDITSLVSLSQMWNSTRQKNTHNFIVRVLNKVHHYHVQCLSAI